MRCGVFFAISAPVGMLEAKVWPRWQEKLHIESRLGFPGMMLHAFSMDFHIGALQLPSFPRCSGRGVDFMTLHLECIHVVCIQNAADLFTPIWAEQVAQI
mmetsp:Transcript_119871/g.211648  ORF Transcript_119871/g.211648 Transcript_119871/m.211648 type:complete len:100 (+) Transcript_119871:28-327(+)